MDLWARKREELTKDTGLLAMLTSPVLLVTRNLRDIPTSRAVTSSNRKRLRSRLKTRLLRISKKSTS
jgi:hypothetical protein